MTHDPCVFARDATELFGRGAPERIAEAYERLVSERSWDAFYDLLAARARAERVDRITAYVDAAEHDPGTPDAWDAGCICDRQDPKADGWDVTWGCPLHDPREA